MNNEAPKIEAVKKTGKGVGLGTKLKPLRTTFRLSPSCTEDLRKLASWMGISEKEVLDSYTVALTASDSGDIGEVFYNVLSIRVDKSTDAERKTRVISRRTLQALDCVAEKHLVSRDWVLECVVRTAVAITQMAKEQTQKDLDEALEVAEALHEHVASELGRIRKLTEETSIFVTGAEGIFMDAIEDIKDERRVYESLDFSSAKKDDEKHKGKGR